MPLTFAYGSNLDFSQMRERCPSTQFVCKAVLKDYILHFPRFSRGRNCGVSGIAPSLGRNVWGVVYEISELDLAALDTNEGYRSGRSSDRNAYNRQTGVVFKDGDPNQPVWVEIYFAVAQANPPYLPNLVYKNLIVSGAKFWNLPAEYIAELENIEVAA